MDQGTLSAMGDGAPEQITTYGVFVSGLRLSAAEVAQNLQHEGMSAERARQVVSSIPCFVKKDVPLAVAEKFKLAFEKAGAWVVLENWQETQNPAADQPNAEELRAAAEAPSAELALDDQGNTNIPFPELGELPALAPAEADSPVAPIAGSQFEPRELAPTPGEQALDMYDVPAPKPKAESDRPGQPGFVIHKAKQEPFLQRNWVSLVLGGVCLFFVLYCYGCWNVMQTQTCMKKKLSRLSVILGNVNAKGQVVTQSDLNYEARSQLHKCGVKVSQEAVHVEAHQLEIVPNPNGSCHIKSMPDIFMLLPQYEKTEIMQGSRNCMLPNWLVRVQVTAKVRWFLSSETYEVVRALPLWRYQSDIEQE